MLSLSRGTTMETMFRLHGGKSRSDSHVASTAMREVAKSRATARLNQDGDLINREFPSSVLGNREVGGCRVVEELEDKLR